MLTVDDLAGLEIFAGVPSGELARLRQTAADVHLAEGEFLTHEGAARVLFVVIAGRIELTKTFSGEERVLGARLPGKIYGEVPMVFGTEMQANARATEPSRVLRIEPAQYHPLAAASPKFAQKVGALALERLGGLQEIASEPPKPQALMLGDRWDPAAHELKRFLSRNQIRFEWVTSTTRSARRSGARCRTTGELPALKLADGTRLFRPELRRLAGVLGLRTAASLGEYDTVIIGGGPAGLAAAVYGASEGLRTLVVESEAPGGQAETSSRIENYLGFPSGISGDELASRALRQANRLGAEILITRRTQALDPETRDDPARRRRGDRGADDHPRDRGELAADRHRGLRPADRQGHLLRRGPQRGRGHAGPAGLPDRRRQLGRPGGALLRQPRPDGDAGGARGEILEKSMSQYLIDQIRTKSNIRVALRSEVDGRVRRRSSGGDRPLRPRDRHDGARGVRRALRLHRRRRRDRLAAAGDRPRPARLRADRAGRGEVGAMDA